MSDTTPQANYREKYKAALLEQDRLEKQMQTQVSALKKTLFQIGAAVSGTDKSLDTAVTRLRETMSGGTGAQVLEQMEQVHQCIEEFEQNRGLQTSKAVKSMCELIGHYGELQIPKPLRTSLNDFTKTLRQRLDKVYQYPLVLDDLAKLQLLALSAASQPKASLLERLRGGVTLAKRIEENAPPGSGEMEREAVQENVPLSSKDPLDEDTAPIRLDDADEDSYAQVAKRISNTLASLVDKIEPNDAIKHRVDIVRHRIDRGMDWYVLAVTLEDIRDILFLRYLQADEEFSAYLAQVRTELSTIRDALMGVQSDSAEEIRAANDFSDNISTGMARIRHSVAESTHMDTLKNDVSDHIDVIAKALKEFKERPKGSLGDQLSHLMEQVKAIENESVKTKAALEEQRHKATHDALTGLPNREAYSDRIFQELQRFERYHRPLTLCICDIDHFKKINDGFGHAAGDKVLKLIASVVAQRLRSVDFIARFGGEEFVILMPETAPDKALLVLNKIRKVVAKTPFRFKDSPVNITISFGLSEFSPGDTSASVFERADQALYQAKAQGRNCCIIVEAPDPREHLKQNTA